MKKSKKFVLTGLALLAAITMVLLPLAGCKNDTVPPEVEKQEQGDGGGSETDKNNTAAKLVSISVTPSARTVYSVGEKVAGEIEVTATYDDGEEKPVTGTITTDTSTLTQSAGIGKKVTVSYTEGDTRKEATFTVDVASYQFTETVQNVDSSYAGTMTGETYKKFGDWPQTIKEEDVEIGAGTLVRGGLTYYVGNDGNYYVKAEENACAAGYKYSDDSEVKQKDEGSSPSTQWFKVEPIVWRVLTTSYKAPEGGTAGNALLLAESILTGGIPYYHFDWEEGGLNGKEWRGPRIIEDKTIHPNNYEHSQIRAWLNGLEYEYKKDANTAQTTEKKYLAAGFLQTAFTADAQDKIADTSVDNSGASTNPASDPNLWNSGTNPYASDIRTTDKVFLLSEAEATTGAYLKADEDYGFDEYYKYVGDGTTLTSTRIRVTTDYAKATGAYQGDPSAGYGGWWWLRSPNYGGEYYARGVNDYGNADSDSTVDLASGGVVPALCIPAKQLLP